MHVMTILGTRPEIIRLSRVIPALDACCRHTLVHTGQNFDDRLSDIFFDELELRSPCHHLGVEGDGFGEQVAQILERCERLLAADRPDRVLVLGDTNSALAAIVAKRMGIPVFHMEAGNRCYDDRVPEEVNRRIVDHCSDVLMPYTGRSRANLLAEGISTRKIFVTGNPIGEIIHRHQPDIDGSDVLTALGLGARGYFLVTLHRAENIDPPARRRLMLESLQAVATNYGLRVIVSVHPRLRARLESDIEPCHTGLEMHPPFGFFDFLKIEKNALCVLSDSGTVQEECAILKVPSVTLRDVTERPETLECGANILAGAESESIPRATARAVDSALQWNAPEEYLRNDVSETVVKLVTGYHHWLNGA